MPANAERLDMGDETVGGAQVESVGDLGEAAAAAVGAGDEVGRGGELVHGVHLSIWWGTPSGSPRTPAGSAYSYARQQYRARHEPEHSGGHRGVQGGRDLRPRGHAELAQDARYVDRGRTRRDVESAGQ